MIVKGISTIEIKKTTFCFIGLFLLLLTTFCHGRVHQGTHYCESYEREKCKDCKPTKVDCSDMRDPEHNTSFDKPNNYMQCYVMWYHSNSTTPYVVMKGCWLNSESCKNVEKCVDTRATAPSLFCCCDGDMCNTNFYHRPEYTDEDHRILGSPRGGKKGNDLATGQSTAGAGKPGVVRRTGEYELSKTILCSIVPIVAFVILVVTSYFMWRRHCRHPGHHQLPTMDPNLVHTPSEQALDIQLLEHKAKGRFGYVWKAKLLDQFVAVKIFPLADKKSFSSEVDIYKISGMRHENILLFIASEVKEDNSYTEFFLISEYHDRGSLYDFLKANTITWAQLCRIGETMTCGLTYLHDEIPATYNTAMKPAIAHRDFKSKNVLIKSDLSACIADFGLALAFVPNLGVNETHTQVGTRRYMAPEVLEGAICFNMDSFLRIDMYACSLVLWELMTRCTCVDDVVGDYRLPFEAEVGLQPSLEEMQPLVVEQKRRPIMKPSWFTCPGMSNLVETVEECWDQDAEARLLAGCVHDRIAQFSRTINTGGGGSGGDGDNNNTSTTNITSSHLSSPPPPFPGPPLPQQQQQQQQPPPQYILEQHQQHQLCSYPSPHQQQQHTSSPPPPSVLNNCLLSNNTTSASTPPPPHYHNHNHHQQHHHQQQLYHPSSHLQLQQQQQQPQLPPPVYVPTNSSNSNNNSNIQPPPVPAQPQPPPPPPPPPPAVIMDHNVNNSSINNSNNSSNNNSYSNGNSVVNSVNVNNLSSSPMGRNVVTTRDLSSC